MALLILYFVPFDLLTPQESFRAVSDKLFVSPVVRTLVFTKASRSEVSGSALTELCLVRLLQGPTRHTHAGACLGGEYLPRLGFYPVHPCPLRCPNICPARGLQVRFPLQTLELA